MAHFNGDQYHNINRDRIGFMVYQLELAVHYYIGDHSDTPDQTQRLQPLWNLVTILQQEFSDDNQNLPTAFGDLRNLVKGIEGALKGITPDNTINGPHSLSNLLYDYYQAHPDQRYNQRTARQQAAASGGTNFTAAANQALVGWKKSDISVTKGDAQRAYESIIVGLIKSLETYVYYKDSRGQTGKTQALSAIKGKIAFAPCPPHSSRPVTGAPIPRPHLNEYLTMTILEL